MVSVFSSSAYVHIQRHIASADKNKFFISVIVFLIFLFSDYLLSTEELPTAILELSSSILQDIEDAPTAETSPLLVFSSLA